MPTDTPAASINGVILSAPGEALARTDRLSCIKYIALIPTGW